MEASLANSLQARHAGLDRLIEEEARRPAPDAARMQGGLQRIAWQLDLIEDRARTIWRGLADPFGSGPPVPGTAPPEPAGPTLMQVLQDALALEDDGATPPDPTMFRSRRNRAQAAR